jgi:hypothetical protein
MYTDDPRYLEIIDLSPKSIMNYNKCHVYLVEILEKWYKEEFEDDVYNILSPVIEKYIDYCKFYIGENNLYEELRNSFNSLVTEILTNKNERRDIHYYSTFRRIQKLRVLMKSYESEMELSPAPEIIIPDLADKTYAGNLITEAINIIRDCDDLRTSAKNNIIKFLTDALNELNSDRTNWTTVFGKTSLVIATIAALTSIVVNSNSILELKGASDKVKEATQCIIEESFQVNRLSVKSFLNLKDNNFKIKGNQILLPEIIDNSTRK